MPDQPILTFEDRNSRISLVSANETVRLQISHMKSFHRAMLKFGYDCSMSLRMKRLCLPGVIAAALYVVLVATAAQAEVIHKFHADITINPDASIDVTETIDMDFEGDEKHGIYRQIPVQYERHNASYTLAFDLKSVQVDGADSTDYEVQRQGADELIRIGNANTKLTGDHIYKIAYHVRRALNFTGEDHSPELYWNVTGNAWPYAIE